MCTKKCSSCGLEKPLEVYRKGQAECPCCQRDRLLRHNYGITLNQYNDLYAAQGGVCKICHKPQQHKTMKNLCVDHCHKTGQVRGLLCHYCNTALGKFNDDIETLQRAIQYLRAAAEG